MGMAEDQGSMEPSHQVPEAGNQGFLQRGVLVALNLSSAVLAQIKSAPVVGPVVANVENAVRPYSHSLAHHGQPLLAFGDKQLHCAYTLVNSAFPVVEPVLSTASSLSDTTLSILSRASESAKERGFFATGVSLYDQYKPAAEENTAATLHNLEGIPLVALSVPLLRYVSATMAGLIDWTVNAGRPKEGTTQSAPSIESPSTAETSVEEDAPQKKGEAAKESETMTDKGVTDKQEEKPLPDGVVAKLDAVLKSDDPEDAVPIVESLFESWLTGTPIQSRSQSRRPSYVEPGRK